ncbi:MAG TPA: lysylphosphatidylglycerol synthase transmembrane domain-containing protein [Steroidobacteraceae bacterium]|nr:lysylphosphatidylglycerol synthase transmembrane domain-containing protein [Steroidobacteraceae bacterium]
MTVKVPQIKPRLRVVLQLGASGALLAFLISRLDWQRSVALLRAAQPMLLLGVIAIQTCDRLLMALKWQQLLRVLDPRLTRWQAIRIYYESTFIGFALPLGGLGPDIVRFARLRTRGFDSHTTLASIVMERLNGVVATLVLLVVGLAVLARLAPQPPLQKFAVLAALAAGAAAVLLAGLIFHPAFGKQLRRLLPVALESPRFAKYAQAARAYSARRPTLAINLVLAIVEQTAPVFTLWVVSRALDAPLPLLVCLAVTPVAVLIQRLPFTYAGLGLREGSAAALLVALGYDYSAALILFMSLFVLFFISLLPGSISLAWSGPPRSRELS